MKKKNLILIILPLLLFACDNVSSSSSSDGFLSSFTPISENISESESSIGNIDEKYEKLDENLFTRLQTEGINVSGTINWKFSGQLTDAQTGISYDGSEKIVVNKFMGQNSSLLNSQVRNVSTSDNEDPDESYSFKVFKNAEGKLTRLYLGADNLVHEVPYMHEEVDDDGYTETVETAYDYYFGNPFSKISYTDLKQNTNGSYSLNFGINNFGTSMLFFGQMFEYDMSSINLYFKDGNINVSVTTNRYAYENSSVYNWFEASFEVSIAEIKDLTKPQPFEYVEENTPLRTAFDELANSLTGGGKGFTYNYTEKNGNTVYAQDITRMTSNGYISIHTLDSSKLPEGVAKYENGENYYFEYRNGNINKFGKSDSLFLPNYSSEYLSSDVFTKESENVYVAKNAVMARYISEQIFDKSHKNAIDGYNTVYSETCQGTDGLKIELKDGHISTITYNYVYFNKKIDGIVNITDINDTSLGYRFVTKNLGPIQSGYENFCGYYTTWEYGTDGDEDNRRYTLLVYGDGRYSFNGNEIKQGKLENDNFVIELDDGLSLSLKYCPAKTKLDLGYSSLSTRDYPVLYAQSTETRPSGTKAKHIVAFTLDESSEYNIDTGLSKGEE